MTGAGGDVESGCGFRAIYPTNRDSSDGRFGYLVVWMDWSGRNLARTCEVVVCWHVSW